MFNEKWLPLAYLDGSIPHNISVELSLLYTFCHGYFKFLTFLTIFNISHLKLLTNMINTKRLMLQVLYITSIHFNVKSKKKMVSLRVSGGSLLTTCYVQLITILVIKKFLSKLLRHNKNVWKQGRDGRDRRMQLSHIYCFKYLYEHQLGLAIGHTSHIHH